MNERAGTFLFLHLAGAVLVGLSLGLGFWRTAGVLVGLTVMMAAWRGTAA